MTAARRGKNIATAGTCLQAVFSLVLVILWQWTDSLSALSCTLLLAEGVPIWLIVALLFYCRQLERREAMELEELARGGAPGSIFHGEGVAELRPAAGRVRFVERWIVPVFTLLWAASHVVIAVVWLRSVWGRRGGDLPHTAEAALFFILVTFVSFLFSRYCAGMSRVPEWRLLRAAGSYLLVNSVAAAAVAGALLAESQGNFDADLVVAYVLPCVQLLLGAELVLNFLLDLFRPRVPGQEERPSFDSRLLGLLAEPGKVGRSLAEAINYQFGFEVSKTWFYQLLSKAAVPLLVFAVAVIFAMTSIVVVREGERQVVFHWGRARGALGPGIHLKWPWPIDRAERFNVGKVHEILLGVGGTRDPQQRKADFVGGDPNGRELFLWTTTHGGYQEQDFLVAVAPRGRGEGASAGAATRPEAMSRPAAPSGPLKYQPPPPVNIIKLVVSVQYVIEDPYKFGYRCADAAKLLECVCYREMTRYCASATLDEPIGGEDANRPEALMTYGQARAAQTLRDRIVTALGGEGGLDLGVRIVTVGFLAVHPPAEAAPAYEAVLEAERRVDEKRFEAEAQAVRTLVEVAGNPQMALELALSIQVISHLESLKNLLGAPAAFTAKLDEYVGQEQQSVKSLDAEIERDRLLGRLRIGEETRPMLLRRRHLAHVAQLEGLKDLVRKGQAPDFPKLLAEAREAADELFSRVTGQPAVIVAKAVAERWTKELSARAEAESFHRKLVAFQASPRLYMLERLLEVYGKVLPKMTKYILAVDREKVQLRVNLEEQPGAGGRPTFGSEEVSPRK